MRVGVGTDVGVGVERPDGSFGAGVGLGVGVGMGAVSGKGVDIIILPDEIYHLKNSGFAVKIPSIILIIADINSPFLIDEILFF